MHPTKLSLLFSFLFLLSVLSSAHADLAGAEKNLSKINLPKGFSISVFAEVTGARQMALGQSMGTVFVGTVDGNVYGVVDKDKDRRADEVVTMMSGLNAPNGVAMHQGFLYVAENHRIVRYPGVGFSLHLPWSEMGEVIYEGMPSSFHHGWRYIRFDKDDKLYVGIGAPCNICEVKGIEGTIIRMDADGKNMEIFANGVRNTVGFDFHPKSQVLHFTDNGVDQMGDSIPPGELNAAAKPGMHFGFPYFAGGREQHKDWKDKKAPENVTFPLVEFGAHGAVLGMTFYTGDMFPKEYRNDAFVAQHGSWNRSEPFGYRIMRVKFDKNGKVKGKEVFADGWLVNGEAWGRPVDILQLTDGSILVSDNYQGVIYRISYQGD
ncbi:MAG: glucose/arabinose dehydrogenase [Planctomycetota bacterium]|jgi:glucose/arabinose dehydrogenase